MIRLVRKIVSTPKTALPIDLSAFGQPDIVEIGGKLEEKVKKLFRGSLAVRQVDAGSDNAAEQELVALSNPFYDVERFGIHFVASPRHADMLMATGPVTRNMAEALRRAYAATPTPKIVVALGDDAISGGIYRGSYAVLDAVKNVIPVDYEIPGDPPSPMTVLCSLLKILGDVEQTSASR
jgi:Ni,Fe-hydrogenase III small subunit